MDDKLTLKSTLKEARIEKGLSQQQLAEMVGVSRNTISSIETGQFNPTAKTVGGVTIHPIWQMDGKTILTLGEVIVLGVLVAILVAVIVLGLKKRAKVSSVVREYESEVKRITWFPWKDTKKSTSVVLIAVVICATVICLLDLGLAEGIIAFINLFGK